MDNHVSYNAPGNGQPDALTRQQALALTVITAESLNWAIIHLSDSGIVAHARLSEGGPESEVIARFEDSGLELYCNWQDKADGEAHSAAMLRKFSDRYALLKNDYTPEALQERYESFGTLLSPGDEDRLLIPPATGHEEKSDFLARFKPVPGYTATPVLIILNVIVFILMLLNGGALLEPSSEVLIGWGANYTPLTLSGQWWRLLSNVFIHIGVIHLLMNMYALIYIGAMLEPRIGTLRFVVAYLLTGIGASLVSLWWHPVVLSAGASGAIFGMYGVFLAMLTTNLIEKEVRKSLMSSIGFFVLYNLAFGMRGGVDNAAHIGGLISGAAIGYAFYPALGRAQDRQLRNKNVLIVLFSGILLSIFAAANIQSDAVAFDKNIARFAENEERVQKLMQDPSLSTDASYLKAFRKALPLWVENVKLAKENSGMDLPKEIQTRNAYLLKYSELRLREIQLALQSANGGQRQDSLQTAVHQEANDVLKILNKQ